MQRSFRATRKIVIIFRFPMIGVPLNFGRAQEMQRSFRAARKSDTIHCPVNLSNHRLKPAGERIMHLSLSENQALAFLSYKI